MEIVRGFVAAVAGLIGLVLLLPVVILAAPFWAVSAMTRAFQRRLRTPVASWKELIQYEPVVGWKARPNLDTRAVAGDAFHFTTDAEGWRGRESLSEADVVVFGDSFAFGFGMDDDRMYTRLVPGVRVKGIGINGYNLVQSLLWMERYAPVLRGKLVVWLVYYGNDLYENLTPHLDQYRMPFVRQEQDGRWGIVTDHVRQEPWIYTRQRQYLARLAEICSGGFLSDRAFSACDYLIGRAVEICREAGANIAIVSAPELTQVSPLAIERLRALSPTPEKFDPDLPDRRLAAICEARGVEFVPLKRYLNASDFNPRDVHWTQNGHRRFAEVIATLHGKYLASDAPAKSSGRHRIRVNMGIAKTASVR